jgi:hypothetical protein
MNFILADMYIPFAPIVPALQFLLLLFIIVFEALFISKRIEITNKKELWWKSSVANLATAVIGILLAVPVSMIEMWLGFGWGSQKHINVNLWWLSCFIYGLGLPWTVWLLCYHISWRTEAAILSRWLSISASKETTLRISIRNAHRWSYGFFAIIVILGCIAYAQMLFRKN